MVLYVDRRWISWCFWWVKWKWAHFMWYFGLELLTEILMYIAGFCSKSHLHDRFRHSGTDDCFCCDYAEASGMGWWVNLLNPVPCLSFIYFLIYLFVFLLYSLQSCIFSLGISFTLTVSILLQTWQSTSYSIMVFAWHETIPIHAGWVFPGSYLQGLM